MPAIHRGSVPTSRRGILHSCRSPTPAFVGYMSVLLMTTRFGATALRTTCHGVFLSTQCRVLMPARCRASGALVRIMPVLSTLETMNMRLVLAAGAAILTDLASLITLTSPRTGKFPRLSILLDTPELLHHSCRSGFSGVVNEWLRCANRSACFDCSLVTPLALPNPYPRDSACDYPHGQSPPGYVSSAPFGQLKSPFLLYCSIDRVGLSRPQGCFFPLMRPFVRVLMLLLPP